MIRSRLEELSLEALLQVASLNGLDVDPDLDRTLIIEQLVDRIDENREERASANSAMVRVQQKKFELLRDDETPPAHMHASQHQPELAELPNQYQINRISLMLRDPRWAFTYWDISAGRLREYETSERFDGLYLRVLEIDGQSEDLSIRESFEIPVQLHDRSWYIFIPNQNSYYRIQLVARNNHRRELLAVSNEVFVPFGALRGRPEDLDPQQMALFELCGMEFLEAPPFDDAATQFQRGAS